MSDQTATTTIPPDATSSLIERVEGDAIDGAAAALAALPGGLSAAGVAGVSAILRDAFAGASAPLKDRIAALEAAASTPAVSAAADHDARAAIEGIGAATVAHNATLGGILGLLTRLFPHEAASIPPSPTALVTAAKTEA